MEFIAYYPALSFDSLPYTFCGVAKNRQSQPISLCGNPQRVLQSFDCFFYYSNFRKGTVRGFRDIPNPLHPDGNSSASSFGVAPLQCASEAVVPPTTAVLVLLPIAVVLLLFVVAGFIFLRTRKASRELP